MKWVFLFLAVVFIDQVSKIYFVPKTINTAGVFGIGSEFSWILVTLLTLCLLLFWWRVLTEIREKVVVMVMIASGFSNLVDRIFFGGVRDFIWWSLLSVYGNMADVFLTLSAFLLLVFYLRKT